MKTLRSTTIALLTLLSATIFAHADGISGMNMKDAPMSNQMANQMNGKVHHGIGTVQKVDTANSRITISHGPINSIQWPPMTMTFAVQNKKLLDQVVAGEKIEFDLIQVSQDQYAVTRITPMK
jgi:Cu(I)/Ag(I) efflux system protein CusF